MMASTTLYLRLAARERLAHYGLRTLRAPKRCAGCGCKALWLRRDRRCFECVAKETKR
jgi:hypothetical protein